MLLKQGDHEARSLFRRYSVAQSGANIVITTQHDIAGRLSGQDLAEFVGHVGYTETVGKKFRYDFAIGNEIDQADVVTLKYMVKCPSEKTWERGFIAHHLWHIEQCCLERCRAARYQSGCGMSQ